MKQSLKIGIALAFTGVAAFAGAATAADEEVELKHPAWQHHGPFGTFDRATLQRGLTVFENVCNTCHSLKYVHYRNLEALGFTEDEVKGIAAKVQVEDGPNEDGDMFMRPAKPSDHFRSPFPNDAVARLSNGGALPPDLSVMVEAREGHEDYIYSLLTGYQDPPADVEMAAGKSYNVYFSGHQIGMPAPLSEGLVDYPDGTDATVEQMAHDVVTFLAWASEPNMEQRKEIGFKVVIFMTILSILLILSNRKIWKKLKSQNA
jgi:ubiquinol-cytochrome c reductase cytochrome c1 subunit